MHFWKELKVKLLQKNIMHYPEKDLMIWNLLKSQLQFKNCIKKAKVLINLSS
jgi:hypothetical protein